MKRDPNIAEVYQNKIAALRAQLTARDAEVERLRAAVTNYLTAMDEQTLSRFPMTGYTAKHLDECLGAMRAALKGEG